MKEVLFIYSWLPSEFLGTLSYPNHYRMTKFSSICLANLRRQISKVFVYLEALWRKYLFYISKNDMKFIQFLHMPKLSPSSKLQLSQIIYVSPGSIYILWPDWHVAKQVLSRPFLLPSNFLGHSSIPKSSPHDNIQLHFPGKSFSGNFQSFYLERSFVK